jgi:hypothetical protein
MANTGWALYNFECIVLLHPLRLLYFYYPNFIDKAEGH